MAVLSKYSGEASHDAAVHGQLLSVVGSSVLLVSLVGGSQVLHDTYIEFADSGYREKLVEYPIFNLLLLKGFLQKCASVVFERLHPFSMTEFIVVRLKGVKHCNWMASRHVVRRAFVSGDISMPSVVEGVGNIVGVWPLIVFLRNETGRKTDGDGLVV